MEYPRQESNQSNVKSQIASIKKKLSKLKELYLNDLITLEEYKIDQQNMTSQIEELEKTVCVPNFDNIEKIEEILSEGWKESYDSLQRAEKRNAWRIIIKQVKVNPDRSISYTLNA